MKDKNQFYSLCIVDDEDVECVWGGNVVVLQMFIKSLVGNLKVFGFKGTSASRLGSNIDLVVVISRSVNVVQD